MSKNGLAKVPITSNWLPETMILDVEDFSTQKNKKKKEIQPIRIPRIHSSV